jgi:16S rRNA (cytosine1402-N4)-methyltransferase
MPRAIKRNMSETPHKRRVRYKGTHPRHFTEKYKELNADRYADDIQKVMQRGQTPAGMHRPICVDPILEILNPQPGSLGFDATLGYGGHTLEFLKRITPGGKLFATDVDPMESARTESRLRALGYDENTLAIHRMNFAGIAKVCEEAGRGFDFVLADLGVSSMQIDNPERGFTFKADGPLDLRLNPTRGLSAADWIRKSSQGDLALMLYDHADEPHAEAIAAGIFAKRESIRTTLQLAETVRSALQTELGNKVSKTERDEQLKASLQRTFQALRIAVNDEFGALDRFLALLPHCLAPGGRVAILTFHSGEDRRVKKSFRGFEREGVYAEVAPEPIRPSPEERHANPRSACAKLRWARMPSE